MHRAAFGETLARVFLTLNMLSGFWQLGVHEDSRDYTTFTSWAGAYRFKRLPFGLINSPSSFQRALSSALHGLNFRICLCYIDDVLVFSNNFQQHLTDLRSVLDRLRSANFRLKPTKCSFARSSVVYLGHVLSKDGLSPNPANIQGVQDFPTPTRKKHVKAFLGVSGF